MFARVCIFTFGSVSSYLYADTFIMMCIHQLVSCHVCMYIPMCVHSCVYGHVCVPLIMFMYF